MKDTEESLKEELKDIISQPYLFSIELEDLALLLLLNEAPSLVLKHCLLDRLYGKHCVRLKAEYDEYMGLYEITNHGKRILPFLLNWLKEQTNEDK